MTGVLAVLAWRAAYVDDDDEEDDDGVVPDLEALAGVGSDNNTCDCGCWCACAFDEFICTVWLTVDARPSVSGGAVAGPAARARAEADTAAAAVDPLIGEAKVAACKRERLRTGTPEKRNDDRETKRKNETGE